MVFFICDTCQETIKKNKVDAHTYKCPQCWILSCVDCGKRFAGEEYAAHNSCISEAEKYQGALYQPKSGGNGQKKDPQTRWLESIQKVCEDVNSGKLSVMGDTKNILNQIVNQENVPRKAKKFENFLNSAYHIRPGTPVSKELWTLCQKQWEADKEEPNKDQDKSKEQEMKKEQEKSKEQPDEEVSAEEQPQTEDNKPWKKYIKNALKKAENRELKLKEIAKILGQDKKLVKTIVKQTPSRFMLKKKVVKLLPKAGKAAQN